MRATRFAGYLFAEPSRTKSTISCEFGSRCRFAGNGWLNGLLGAYGRQHAGGHTETVPLPPKLPSPGVQAGESIRQLYVATDASTFPAESIARTLNACVPSLRPE